MAEQISAAQRHKLKAFIKVLKGFKGRHTELVSVYVPEGYDMNKITAHLAQEQGTASNIKSKQTRDNVIAALERMLQQLKLVQRTPSNGLAAFSGNVAEREGQQDYQVWTLEPPLPLKQRIYRCDKEFVLDPLEEMVSEKSLFGLVVMDKREGNIALLRGKTIVPLNSATSAVPGKTRAGGQSSVRFERLREGATKDFMKKIAGMMKTEYLDKKELKGILVGGPGHTKNEFVDSGYITDQLRRKIIAIKDLSYTGEFGLQELLEKSADVLSEEEVVEEKKVMQKFFTLLATRPGLVNYGAEAVSADLRGGVVDTLLLSESLDDETIARFEGEAEPYSSKVVLVSVETREGAQLAQMGKVAAILRYEMAR